MEVSPLQSPGEHPGTSLAREDLQPEKLGSGRKLPSLPPVQKLSADESKKKQQAELLRKKRQERKAAAKARSLQKKHENAVIIQRIYRGRRDRNRVSKLRNHDKTHHETPNQNAETIQEDLQDGEEEETLNYGLLRVQIYGVLGLQTGDESLRSYVRIVFDDRVEYTEKVAGLNPQFNIEAPFEIENLEQAMNDKVVIELWSSLSSQDELLGANSFSMMDILSASGVNGRFRLFKRKEESGEIQLHLLFEYGTLFDDSGDEGSETQEPIADEDQAPEVWPEIMSSEPEGGWSDIDTSENATKKLAEQGFLRLLVVTWNLQAHKPPDDLKGLFRPLKFHLYAIGTEECCNSIAKSTIFRSKKEWESALRKTLGDEYIMLCSHGLQAIHNIVFAHKSVIPLINHVHSSAVPTGLANQMGNKGGVAIAINICATSFAFVSCHFEAHQKSVSKRNDNFHKINAEAKLRPNRTARVEKNDLLTETFDRVFWSGDLNYRINGTRKSVDAVLQKQMHSVLLNNDQLLQEKNEGKIFKHFKEGPLHFYPTYKFDRESDTYDSSAKQRIPSWTDRILYRSNGNAQGNIRLHTYNSYSSYKTSDHRPVFAVFDVDFLSSTQLHLGIKTNQTHSEVCCIQYPGIRPHLNKMACDDGLQP